MRFFGKKSVSSILGICLTVAWYAGIALTAAGLWTMGVLIFMNQEKLLGILQKPGVSFNLEADFLTVKMPMTVLKSPRVLAGFMAMASVKMAFGLAVIFQLKKIFTSLCAGPVFKEENAKRIRMIGILTFASAFAEMIVSGLMGSAVVHDIVLAGAKIQASIDLSLETIFAGFVFLVLGEIFRHGAQLQTEQDLTV
jgi:hypothetical protein